jgi:hypothetical protein
VGGGAGDRAGVGDEPAGGGARNWWGGFVGRLLGDPVPGERCRRGRRPLAGRSGSGNVGGGRRLSCWSASGCLGVVSEHAPRGGESDDHRTPLASPGPAAPAGSSEQWWALSPPIRDGRSGSRPAAGRAEPPAYRADVAAVCGPAPGVRQGRETGELEAIGSVRPTGQALVRVAPPESQQRVAGRRAVGGTKPAPAGTEEQCCTRCRPGSICVANFLTRPTGDADTGGRS